MFFDKIKLLQRKMIANCTQGSFRERAPFIIGGIIVGVLGLWLFLKIMTPAVRAVCKIVLQDSGSTHRQGKPVPVEAALVEHGNISRRIVTVGRLRAKDEVMLKSEIHGRIDEILFQEGTRVEKGDLLIQFDDADTRATIKQAEAELTLHKAEFDRVSRLHSQNIHSNKQLDEIVAKRDAAEGKVEEAEATLKKKRIIAPFSGNIGIVSVSPGAYVQANHDLVMLVNINPIVVDFKVPEKNVHDVGAGQIAEIRVEGFKDEIFRFTVDAVDSKVNEQSHSLAIRASNPNEENQLHAGLFANVSLIVGDKSDALLIPETALHREGEAEFVWTIKQKGKNQGKAGRQRVISGTRENNTVEIVAGLRPGTLVVTAGHLRLGEGSAVKITNMDEEKKEEKEQKEKEEEKKEEAAISSSSSQDAAASSASSSEEAATSSSSEEGADDEDASEEATNSSEKSE
ncbi:MAG: efflux RND transporter periplasmic adaptor subunit [Alphaproteobacteria bacterium]